MSLFAGNVSHRASPEEVRAFFAKFGLCRVDVKRGYAFIDYDDDRDAEDARNDTNGKDFHGMKLNVEWSKKHLARTAAGSNPTSADWDRGRRSRYPEDRRPRDYDRDYDRDYRRRPDPFPDRERNDRDRDRDYDRRRDVNRPYDRDRDDASRYDRGRYDRDRRDRDRDRDRTERDDKNERYDPTKARNRHRSHSRERSDERKRYSNDLNDRPSEGKRDLRDERALGDDTTARRDHTAVRDDQSIGQGQGSRPGDSGLNHTAQRASGADEVENGQRHETVAHDRDQDVAEGNMEDHARDSPTVNDNYRRRRREDEEREDDETNKRRKTDDDASGQQEVPTDNDGLTRENSPRKEEGRAEGGALKDSPRKEGWRNESTGQDLATEGTGSEPRNVQGSGETNEGDHAEEEALPAAAGGGEGNGDGSAF